MAIRFFFLILPTLLFSNQALYLVQRGEVQKGIDAYLTQAESSGHDFEVLQQLATILLEQGAHSTDAETQLLSLYGCSIAGKMDSLSIYEHALLSRNPTAQITAVNALGQMDDDRAVAILCNAFNSNYLMVRMEAAYHLAQRKHPLATQQLEALMYKLPPPMRAYFPEFFSMIGTPKAIAILKQLINDSDLNVRSSAALSAAEFGRDDLLDHVRALASHNNPAELEVSAIALARLGDTHARDTLLKLTSSPFDHVRLAAHRALYILGDHEQMDEVAKIAQTGDIHAILALGSMADSDHLIKPFLSHSDRDVRFNAALALLQLGDPACTPIIAEFLTAYTHETALQPSFSTGRAMSAWRFAPASVKYSKMTQTDVMALTYAFKERVLNAAIELPEKDFLCLARLLFDTRVTPLIPSLVAHLESLATDDAIALLKINSNAVGAPLIRAFCNLALYRLDVEGPYSEHVILEALRLKDSALIRFEPTPQKKGTTDNHRYSPLTLSPEQTSRLLIETFQTLAARHEPKSIEILLRAIADGEPKNRYALAGILLKTLE